MSEHLFRAAAEVQSDSDDPSQSSTPVGDHIRDSATTATATASSPATSTTKRQSRRDQVPAACQRCRRRKTKCDGLRPCTPCAKSNNACQYETNAGETRLQASKRKYSEMDRAHDTHAALLRVLQTGSHQQAAVVLRQLREGHTPEAILRFTKTDDKPSGPQGPDRHAVEAFLTTLAHCTASHREIIVFALSALNPAAQLSLPGPQEYVELRDRVVHITNLDALLRRSNPTRLSLPELVLDSVPKSLETDTLLSFGTLRSNGGGRVPGNTIDFDFPHHQVSAEPWTHITTNDQAVSHLVSLFLAWINPSWRFVEPDLFLKGMHSKSLESDLCSPFLLNSICAIASLHSEHEVAFTSDKQDRISRGQHFHDEAVRLWALEDSRPTITNIQALCVLSLESNYRAKDKLGLTLVPIALQLNDRVPLLWDEARYEAQDISDRDFARLRLAAHWTAKCTHIIMCLAFMSPSKVQSTISGLPKLHDAFDDTLESWVGYPLTNAAVPHRPTLYLRKRCELALLFEQMHDLVISNAQQPQSIFDFATAVDALSGKMRHWFKHLPFELHYVWPMSVDVWELHASYLASFMILYTAARTRFAQASGRLADGEMEIFTEEEESIFRSQQMDKKLSEALELAYQAARILRDFRERFGLKITPAWLLQLQAITAGVLLSDPDLAGPTTIVGSPSSNRESQHNLDDSNSAFDEVFRSLIGTSVEVMIARGIARMVYHTTLEKEVTLSPPVRSMLQIMSSASWRPSDLALVQSDFPNFAATSANELEGGRLTELLSKWEGMDL